MCSGPLRDRVEHSFPVPNLHLSWESASPDPPHPKAVRSLGAQNTSRLSVQSAGLHSTLNSGLGVFIDEYDKANTDD